MITDHKGQTFNNTAELCKHWNIGQATFNNRFYTRGLSMQETLETPIRKVGKSIILNGRKFESCAELCRLCNINEQEFKRRLSSGMTPENALKAVRYGVTRIKDHKGNKFSTLKECAEHWNIKYQVLQNRLKSGWSIEKALTEPIDKTREVKSTIDHLGNKFESLSEMYRYWNISESTFRDRIARGDTLKEALEGKLKADYVDKGRVVTDHAGNQYATLRSMCEAYGISVQVLRTRMKAGKSLEESLMTPVKRNNTENKTLDHLGNKFKTLDDMCNYYNISISIYYKRINKGYTLEEALTKERKNNTQRW